MHLGIGMDGAASLDLGPARRRIGAPRAGGGRRVAQQAALGAGLQMEIMRGAMPEILEVLAVELADVERHVEILGFDGHGRSPQPRRITMAEPVPGIAQPRLALSSASLT